MMPVPTLQQIIQVVWNCALGVGISVLTAVAAGTPVTKATLAAGILTVLVPLFQRPK